MSNVHIKVTTDNSTAVAYINSMGGSHSLPCNDMAREIWEWCTARNITTSHIPGTLNIEADKGSRAFDDSKEWKLNADIFLELTSHFGIPKVDMFASWLNYQMMPYVSCHPDPQAWAIDALTLDWSNMFFYVFLPFSIIPQVLQKLDVAQAQAILIVPNWPTQPWYPTLTKLLVQQPILPKNKSNVTLPSKHGKTPIGHSSEHIVCIHCFRGNFHCGYAPYGTEVHERGFSSQTGIAQVPSNMGYICCSIIPKNILPSGGNYLTAAYP